MPSFSTSFTSEKAFEDALIERLIAYGWEETVLQYQTESQLLQNWADILFENNRDIDRLGGLSAYRWRKKATNRAD